MSYIECSAKENEKVGEIFAEIARILMKRELLKTLPSGNKKGTGLKEPNNKPKSKCC